MNPVDQDHPLTNIALVDCNDIEGERDYASSRSDQIMLKDREDLSKVLKHIRGIFKACAFVVGGSDEMARPLVDNATGGAIIVDASLDVRQKCRVQLDIEPATFHETCKSHLRDVVEASEHVPVTFFGLQGHLVTKFDVDTCKPPVSFVYINRDIRRKDLKAVEVFSQIKGSADTVSIDLSALKTEHCCGVTYPSPAAGFTREEAESIAFEAGLTMQFFGVSEFNPAIEKFKTGTLVVQLLN